MLASADLGEKPEGRAGEMKAGGRTLGGNGMGGGKGPRGTALAPVANLGLGGGNGFCCLLIGGAGAVDVKGGLSGDR